MGSEMCIRDRSFVQHAVIDGVNPYFDVCLHPKRFDGGQDVSLKFVKRRNDNEAEKPPSRVC